MSKMLITHIAYLLLIVAVVVSFKEEIVYCYIHKKISKDAYVINLSEDIALVDKSGREVGRLYQGVELMSPALDDVSDTDISDNMRFKLLVDLSLDTVQSSRREKKDSMVVYKIRNDPRANQ